MHIILAPQTKLNILVCIEKKLKGNKGETLAAKHMPWLLSTTMLHGRMGCWTRVRIRVSDPSKLRF